DPPPWLAHRLPGRPGILEGPRPRLVAHARRLPGADRAERDGRGLAARARGHGDLRHLPLLARQAGLRREGGTVHLRPGAEVARVVVQREELARAVRMAAARRR